MLGFLGVYVSHLVSYLCCVFWGGIYVAHLVSYLWVFLGSMMLILLVNCVVFFLEGVYVAHLVS